MLLLKPAHEALKAWVLGLDDCELTLLAREVKVVDELAAQSLECLV